MIVFGVNSDGDDDAIIKINNLVNSILVNPNRINKIMRLDRNNKVSKTVPIKLIVPILKINLSDLTMLKIYEK